MKKKMLLIAMLSMLATAMLGVTAADAHHNHFNRHGHGQYNQQNNQQRDDARFVLQRTADVLQRAQNSSRNDRDQWGRRGRRYRNNRDNQFKGLGFAFSIQAEACDLYQQGRYQETIDYSLRARAAALRVLNRNGRGEGWKNDDDLRNCDMDRNELDTRERRYWEHRPNGSFQVHGHDVSDDAVVDFHIQLNF
ncbi:MAG TPA: hypothetical protein VHR47_09850 [Bacillota bacterium]|nr:hypothetical protein [Bacillota bacterium]